MQDINQKTAVINEWEATRCPATLARSEHNFNVLGQAIATVDPLTVEGLVQIVQELDGQRKLEHINPAPAAASNEPPHGDIPAVAAFNYVEDFDDKAKVAKFLRDVARANDLTLHIKFAERQEFIKQNNIRRPFKGSELAPRRSPADAKILCDIKDCIDRFVGRNHGQTISIRETLTDEVSRLLNKGIEPRKVKIVIDGMIKEFEPNDSIR